MENTTLVNGLLLPFKIEGLHWSIYGAVNLAMAALGTVGLGISCRFQIIGFARPALVVALLANLIFQWPLALFSPIIERSLPLYRIFAFSLHLQIVICLLWVFYTPKLSEMIIPPKEPARIAKPGLSTWTQVILCLLAIVLTGIYLNRVNLRCTGLYAVITDPSLTLLARELSGKLIGTGAPAYGYGLLSNVICPLLVFISVDRILNSTSAKWFAAALIWIIIGAAATMIILLPGSKGALIPTIIVVGISTLASRRTLLGRFIAVACILGAGLMLMTTFEMLRERKVTAGSGYPFGACAAQMDLCKEAKILLDSLRHHDMSLGVDLIRREKLAAKLDEACSPALKQSDFLPDDLSDHHRAVRPAIFTSAADAQPRTIKSVPRHGLKAEILHVSSDPKPEKPISLRVAIRIWQYTRAIAYRAAVVPLQVASWYYLYSTEYGSPGVKALPGAKPAFRPRVIMPKRIHEVYYPIYSLGDKTSSGTAPTSFIMAYPAYLGLAGIALSLACLLGFDLIASMVLGRCAGSLRWAGIGLVAVGCINFMLSDFGTTLLTHGSGFALLLLIGLTYTEKKKGRSRAGES